MAHMEWNLIREKGGGAEYTAERVNNFYFTLQCAIVLDYYENIPI